MYTYIHIYIHNITYIYVHTTKSQQLWMKFTPLFQFLLWTFWISNILKINNLTFLLEGKKMWFILDSPLFYQSAEMILDLFCLIWWFCGFSFQMWYFTDMMRLQNLNEPQLAGGLFSSSKVKAYHTSYTFLITLFIHRWPHKRYILNGFRHTYLVWTFTQFVWFLFLFQKSKLIILIIHRCWPHKR